jgi:uncharacterized SAM-binding protein YcdF (DUF218 family)
MEYDFSGQITFKDYVQLNKISQQKTFIRKFIPIFYIILALVFIKSTWSDIKIIWENDPIKLIPTIGIPVIIIVGCLLLFNNLLLPFIYKRFYKSNNLAKEMRHYKITNKAIIVSSESVNTNLSKDTINKIFFDKDSIYIYTALNAAHIIKERFLDSETEFKQLVDFIKENFVKRKNGA